MEISREILALIADKFLIPGELVGYETIHNGNINGTFFVDFKNENDTEKYVFQRINTYVFKQPEQIMSNIALISSHMKKKIEAANLDGDLLAAVCEIFNWSSSFNEPFSRAVNVIYKVISLVSEAG